MSDLPTCRRRLRMSVWRDCRRFDQHSIPTTQRYAPCHSTRHSNCCVQQRYRTDRPEHRLQASVTYNTIEYNTIICNEHNVCQFSRIGGAGSHWWHTAGLKSSNKMGLCFLQRVSIACYAERCISYDRFCPTVCPTVRHSPVSCQNDSS